MGNQSTRQRWRRCWSDAVINVCELPRYKRGREARSDIFGNSVAAAYRGQPNWVRQIHPHIAAEVREIRFNNVIGTGAVSREWSRLTPVCAACGRMIYMADRPNSNSQDTVGRSCNSSTLWLHISARKREQRWVLIVAGSNNETDAIPLLQFV